mmetsp:Transcript_3665/g.11280  ORF Transcript_3665/g.11280 Transcript_3665/m.11280 type:complete len:387 (-) Transcript_3665:878-2038(-)
MGGELADGGDAADADLPARERVGARGGLGGALGVPVAGRGGGRARLLGLGAVRRRVRNARGARAAGRAGCGPVPARRGQDVDDRALGPVDGLGRGAALRRRGQHGRRDGPRLAVRLAPHARRGARRPRDRDLAVSRPDLRRGGHPPARAEHGAQAGEGRHRRDRRDQARRPHVRSRALRRREPRLIHLQPTRRAPPRRVRRREVPPRRRRRPQRRQAAVHARLRPTLPPALHAGPRRLGPRQHPRVRLLKPRPLALRPRPPPRVLRRPARRRPPRRPRHGPRQGRRCARRHRQPPPRRPLASRPPARACRPSPARSRPPRPSHRRPRSLSRSLRQLLAPCALFPLSLSRSPSRRERERERRRGERGRRLFSRRREGKGVVCGGAVG